MHRITHVSLNCINLLLLASLLASCGDLLEPIKPSCPPARSNQESLALLNAARQTSRLCGAEAFPAASPLKWDAQLEVAANGHSNDMATRNFYAHINPDGISPSQRTVAAGYGLYTGENIWATPKSMEEAIEGWLQSPGHCKNIMYAAYTDYAIACVSNKNSEYGTYWTQSFGFK